jgi:hypothetical protein
MYVDKDNAYRVGVCIQRMDLTRPLDEFIGGELPQAILAHRLEEYDSIMNSVNEG